MLYIYKERERDCDIIESDMIEYGLQHWRGRLDRPAPWQRSANWDARSGRYHPMSGTVRVITYDWRQRLVSVTYTCE